MDPYIEFRTLYVWWWALLLMSDVCSIYTSGRPLISRRTHTWAYTWTHKFNGCVMRFISHIFGRRQTHFGTGNRNASASANHTSAPDCYVSRIFTILWGIRRLMFSRGGTVRCGIRGMMWVFCVVLILCMQTIFKTGELSVLWSCGMRCFVKRISLL